MRTNAETHWAQVAVENKGQHGRELHISQFCSIRSRLDTVRRAAPVRYITRNGCPNTALFLESNCIMESIAYRLCVPTPKQDDVHTEEANAKQALLYAPISIRIRLIENACDVIKNCSYSFKVLIYLTV